MRLTSRVVFGAIFVACAVLIALAIYMQETMALIPCPMCILQRYAFVAIGAVALLGALHGPKGALGTRIYAVLLILFALVGAGTSIRHSYVQHYPPVGGSCSVELEFLVNAFPLGEALPRIFAGSGDCSQVDWKMLGLSIPEWALVWFLGFIALATWYAFVRKTRS
ncbi:hypothetical protein BWI17_11995 [Betaproteobacteria bacterium GR16-43]|nr:hypothetical protein BWI17_11995 [Betaproteobacteria bacterium GR16-43]